MGDIFSYLSSAARRMKHNPRLVLPYLLRQAGGTALLSMFLMGVFMVLLPLLPPIIDYVVKNKVGLEQMVVDGNVNKEFAKEFAEGLFKVLPPAESALVTALEILALFLLILAGYLLLDSYLGAGALGAVWQGLERGKLDTRSFLSYGRENWLRLLALRLLPPFIYTVVVLVSLFLMFLPSFSNSWTILIIILAVFAFLWFLLPYVLLGEESWIRTGRKVLALLVLVPLLTLTFLGAFIGRLFFLLALFTLPILIIVLSLLFFFAEQNLVISGKGVLDSFRLSISQSRSRLSLILLYFAVYLAFMIFAFLLVFSGLGSLYTLVQAVLVIPLLAITKLVFYSKVVGKELSPVSEITYSSSTIRPYLRDSLRRTIAFTRNGSAYIALAALVYLVGLVGGLKVADVYLYGLRGAITEKELTGFIFAQNPALFFLNVFMNNAYAFSLIALGGTFLMSVPGIVLNGALIGLFYGVLDPRMALSLILPHGVLEIPTMLIAAGAGLKVGLTVLRGGEVDAAFDDLVGMLGGVYLLLLVAALIEAFVTPNVGFLLR